MRLVTSAEVATYRGMVVTVARRFNGVAGAEFDDLEQEGLIAIWEVLGQESGFWGPSVAVVSNACIDWVRYCGRRGYGGYEAASPE